MNFVSTIIEPRFCLFSLLNRLQLHGFTLYLNKMLFPLLLQSPPPRVAARFVCLFAFPRNLQFLPFLLSHKSVSTQLLPAWTWRPSMDQLIEFCFEPDINASFTWYQNNRKNDFPTGKIHVNGPLESEQQLGKSAKILVHDLPSWRHIHSMQKHGGRK